LIVLQVKRHPAKMGEGTVSPLCGVVGLVLLIRDSELAFKVTFLHQKIKPLYFRAKGAFFTHVSA
jgi:hypothetical protein